MSKRIKGLTVTLKDDIREDDMDHIINALRMIKGVLDVTPIENTSDDHIIRVRVDREWREKILKLF